MLRPCQEKTDRRAGATGWLAGGLGNFLPQTVPCAGWRRAYDGKGEPARPAGQAVRRLKGAQMLNRRIRSLVAVADAGSITRAASELYITPQSLSQQITSLENDVEFKLLVRSHKGVELTEAGREFAAGARQIVQLTDDLVRRCAATAHGAERVKVGSLPLSNQVPLIIRACQRLAPELQVELVPSESSDRTLSRIAAEEIDVAEWVDSPRLHEAGLDFTFLVAREYRCLVSLDHPLAARGSVSLEDLARHRVGAPNADWVSNVEQAMRERGLERTIEEIGFDYQRLTSFLLNEHGVFLLLEMEADRLSQYASVPLAEPFSWDYGFVHRRETTAAQRRYMQVASDVYAQVMRDYRREAARGRTQTGMRV